MMSIRFILKNGSEFTTKCREFTINQNGFGNIAGYKMKDIVENKPLYTDFSQIAAVIRVMSDETDDVSVNELES